MSAAEESPILWVIELWPMLFADSSRSSGATRRGGVRCRSGCSSSAGSRGKRSFRPKKRDVGLAGLDLDLADCRQLGHDGFVDRAEPPPGRVLLIDQLLGTILDIFRITD